MIWDDCRWNNRCEICRRHSTQRLRSLSHTTTLCLRTHNLTYIHCINASYTVKGWRMVYGRDQVIKIKVWTRYSAAYMRLVISSALQSRKRQQIGMSQRCRSALCGHPLRALMDNWTHGAASRHTIAPISHTRSSPRSRSYYSFPVPLRVGGWVGLSTQ